MEEIYKSFKAVILFLILIFIVNSFAGQKASEKILFITLLSMVILNAGKFASFMKTTFNYKEV